MIDTRDHVVDRIKKYGGFEKGSTKLWIDICKNLPSEATIVDVGAYTGYYSLLASEYCSDNPTIYAYEPMPDNYQRLIKNTKKEFNIFCHDQAISDNEGTANLYRFAVNKYLTSGASLKQDWLNQSPRETIVVKSMPLDDFFHFIDLIKIDVEGAEANVLRGMERLFKENSVDKIIMEVTGNIDVQELNDLTHRYDKFLIDEDTGDLKMEHKIFNHEKHRNWYLSNG